MCCAQFEKAIHDGEKKWLCEILHIASFLNSENPIGNTTEKTHLTCIAGEGEGNQPPKTLQSKGTPHPRTNFILGKGMTDYLILQNCMLHNLFRLNQKCGSNAVPPLQATTSQPLAHSITKQILKRLF